MRRIARDTLAAVPHQAGVPGAVSGRHRRQGRKPADCAAAALIQNVQLIRFGSGAGQMGRQKTPVVFTPVKKRPSKRESRMRSAR